MAATGETLNLILSHQSPVALGKMLDWWSEHVPRESILIAYGGTKENFGAIEFAQKFFVEDERLRTRDHQREVQSYTEIFRTAADYLATRETQFHFVHFAEYDHLPITEKLNERQIEYLKNERADVIGFHVYRVDGTSNPHFLYHTANKNFLDYWPEISCRADASIVLSMFGSGSFWRYEAFRAVASMPEPFPIYMEIYLPTTAHHLGFRVRDFGAQNRFVGVKDETNKIEQARKDGAWTLHPVKDLWNR